MGRLDELDLSLSLNKEEEAERLDAGWKRLEALRLALGGKLPGYGLGPPVLALFEGWDASGKGGAIKRVTAEMDHRHVRIASFAAPNPDEKRHHYLWRFWPKLPGWGGVAIFDRSWYGRVLVERVEGYASEEEWRRAYGEIVDHERTLAKEGMVLAKFWVHVSDEEQLARFQRRERLPMKRWKLTDEDWRNREKRGAYAEAIEEMFERTDHEDGPWTIVPGDSKKFARVFVIEQLIARIEWGMQRWGMEPLSQEELEPEPAG